MNAKEIYKKETGIEIKSNHFGTAPGNNDYVKWLEKLVSERYEPTILKWIKKMFNHAEKKEWYMVYFTFDLHGTISKPDYRRTIKEVKYYPYAKETLQLLSERKDITTILWTSSYPNEIEIYNKQLKKDNINFDFIGDNPDITNEKGAFGYYEKKHYFNALFEDKSGFNPERDWKFLYDFFKNQSYRPKTEWCRKYKEDYHKL